MADAHGILAIGAYLPRHRLPRAVAVAANRWFAPGLASLGDGHRSFANWDEDAVTMAVEAARDCLGSMSGDRAPERLLLASTSLPFRDRTHAGIVADALDLPRDVSGLDLASSRRAATTALLHALENPGPRTLLVGSECVDPKPASIDELTTGHGAGALLVGRGEVVATLRGSATIHEDLVDRYRADDSTGDYVLEGRWVRDLGHFGFLLEALQAALADSDTAPGDLQHLVLPFGDREAAAIARRLGATAARRPALPAEAGLCGGAAPLLGLAEVMATGEAGDRVLLAGFGQGADALVLEIGPHADRSGIAGRIEALAREVTIEDQYPRYLALRGRLELERGIRHERDDRTAHSAHFRRRRALTGLVAGRCDGCGAVQFPAARVCVACREECAMTDVRLADEPGRVRSFTEDWLAATPRPPLIFGSVDFPGGASLVMEFTDFEPGSLAVGDSVRMAFRIKDIDRRRGYRRYFWKPTPPVSGNPSDG